MGFSFEGNGNGPGGSCSIIIILLYSVAHQIIFPLVDILKLFHQIPICLPSHSHVV